MSMYLGLSAFALFISVTQINEWSRVLNAKPLSLPSACLAAALSPYYCSNFYFSFNKDLCIAIIT